MMHRLSALVLAFLTLLGALHEGVHLLEHAQHAGGDACLHAHEQGQQSEVANADAEGPQLADLHHGGDSHFCPVCFTPQTSSARATPADAVLRLPTELAVRPVAAVYWSRLGSALPPSRGPPPLS